ncbi:MAG: hypothetical protein KAR38_01555, partial [Calditrichia bacterium]|nr:hypothetical protein [Calditrichia bacterium]
WEQKEIQTERVFENYRHNLSTQLNKTFGNKSQHSLSYSYDDYTRSYANNASINNKTSNINLRDVFHFNKKNGDRFTSQINYFNQSGSKDFKRLQINENLGIGLPKHFKFYSKYHFTNYEQSQYKTNQHNILNKLEHRLFASLKSQVFYEYFKLNRSAYSEKKRSAGLNINYNKIIPYGNLYLTYSYKNRNEQRDSRLFILTIINEEHELNDDKFVLLDNPYIDIESIVVTDETGSVLYSKDIDYIILQRGDYIEIQRISGGQILNGTVVFIDYMVSKQTSHEFNMTSNIFNARFNFFKNLFEVYFRYMGQDYNNIVMTDSRILRTIYQHVYGIKISKKFITMGFDIDDFNSNIIPYQSKRYYVTLAGNFVKKINVSITGNHRNYDYINEDENQKYTNIAGRVNYLVNKNSKLKLEGGYRLQDGRGIELNIATLRSEYSYRYRQTFYTIG